MDGIDLDCGIATHRIVSWLDDELRLPHDERGWVFTERQCTCIVQVEPLANRQIGPLSLERTRLVTQGDAEALAAFEKLFTLRFVSTGG